MSQDRTAGGFNSSNTGGSTSQVLFQSLKHRTAARGLSQGCNRATAAKNRNLTTASGSHNLRLTSGSDRYSNSGADDFANITSTQLLLSNSKGIETRATDNAASSYPNRGQKIQDLLNRVRM